MKTALPFAVGSGTGLLGEIITWACSGVAIRHLDLIDALRDAGLDESVARELAPRHAFSRACRKLAQEELDRCIQARTGADVTRIVQKLFERQADLFPIRPQGGCYFVPARHAPFVDKVQDLLNRVGGRLLRFPVPAGTEDGDRSVTRAVADGLAAVVAEHRAAVTQFGADTRADTLARAAERIRATKFKLAAYSEYLSGERDRLDRAVADAEAELRAAVARLASAPAEPAPA